MWALIDKIRKNRFIGNTNWLIFQNVYSMGLSLLVGTLSARYLGPSNYGLIGYGASMVNLFTAISQCGLNQILAGEIINHPEEKGNIIGSALCMRLGTSIISFFCVLILVAFIEPRNYILWVVTALQAFAIICGMYELLNEWFLSELRSKNYVIANMVGQTVTAAWKIFLLAVGASVLWFGASTTIQALVCGTIVWILFFKNKNFKMSFSFEKMKELFTKSRHYILAGLAVALYTQMDKVMVGKMMGVKDVGFYTAAMTVAMLWEFIPEAIINSSKTVILEKKNIDEVEYRKSFLLLLFGINVLGILAGVTVQFLGKLVVYILYGQEYMSAVPVLKLLIWSTMFAMTGVARNIWSVAEDKNQYSKNYTICGGIFNLVFNALTIPVWGIFGAAISTLGAQIMVAVVSPLFWKETRSFVSLYIESWKHGFSYLKVIAERYGRGKNG